LKILVTGGAGFIGSNFIRHILRKYPDYRVINLDKLTYAGNRDNLLDLQDNRNYEFVKGDITDAKLVSKLVKEAGAVINFAAETHVDRSITDAGDFVRTNVFGTFCLLEAVKKFKVAKYIQISTDEVYGSIEKGAFKETNPLAPSSPYSATKASADLLVISYYTTYQMPVIITRSSNNFGPYQYPEKVIPLFITNILEDKPVPLYGDGLNVRDWVYVLDNVEAIDQVLHNGKPGEVYNIGGGNELSNIELTKKMLELLGKGEEYIKPVADRPGHDRRYALDCFKIRTELGWKPQYDFDKALKDTIAWYQNNRSWWERLKGK
jgi:dTDP-glucose 4,6-dehydratase